MISEKEKFLQGIKEAIKLNRSFVVVSIMINDEYQELITIPREGFEQKLKYYEEAYDDDLYHKFSKDAVSITGILY